ncbi:MAG TPA: hypothetical protein VEY30_02140, partial [Myxococcaceae bacterium]|nr:hypothetical protein [Myxococcaceae bacterium]
TPEQPLPSYSGRLLQVRTFGRVAGNPLATFNARPVFDANGLPLQVGSNLFDIAIQEGTGIITVAGDFQGSIDVGTGPLESRGDGIVARNRTIDALLLTLSQ